MIGANIIEGGGGGFRGERSWPWIQEYFYLITSATKKLFALQINTMVVY